jgi:hypothetical protein
VCFPLTISTARLVRLKDKQNGLPMFTVLQIQLACEKCKEDGKAANCIHMLHLVPRWQSSEKHERLRVVMSDRPDLIESELSGLAFDSLQQCFRPGDIEAMFTIEPMPPVLHNEIFIIVDPAAGGPHSDYALVSFQRDRGNVTLIGIESLNTKEPSKQFFLLEEHIRALRQNIYRSNSPITVFVERNLGFEAEHHKHALSHIQGVRFHEDERAGRVGVLTTESVKHAAMELFNMMLREKRVSICAFFHSREPQEIKIKLREQLEVYSFQYKEAANTFQKSRTALSGKIGGLKDDIAICLQLGCYWTSVGVLRKASLGLLGE